MKQCPQCHLTYSNNDVFCMNDGSSLLEITSPNNSSEIPTQVITYSQTADSNPSSNSSKWLYAVIGLLSVVVVGLAIFILLPKSSNENFATVKADEKNEEKVSASEQKSYADEEKNDMPKKSVVAEKPITFENPPTTSERPQISPGGRWSGDWSSPSGAYLTVVFNLNDDGSGKIDGQIEWTLRKTNRPEKMSKIGMSAIEYVRGNYDSTNRVLTLKGYRKDDPNGVLVMTDDYRLNFSDDNQRLNGAAKNGGKWNGKVNLSR